MRYSRGFIRLDPWVDRVNHSKYNTIYEATGYDRYTLGVF